MRFHLPSRFEVRTSAPSDFITGPANYTVTLLNVQAEGLPVLEYGAAEELVHLFLVMAARGDTAPAQ